MTGDEATETSDSPEATSAFTEHRDLLLGVAYRVLGRWTDAEDVVQDAWLRWRTVDHAEVQDPRAFLVRVTTRLALDRLKSAQVRRETYVGPWLPEPILTSLVSTDIADDVALADTVSIAMLVVLETLSPLERAVFVLREAFAFSYAEIGETLDRSEDAVRQLAKRARQHVRERRPRYEADKKTQRRVTDGFLSATMTGDLAALMGLLAPDVVLHTDGGGVVKAARRVIHGADKVGRFMVGIHTGAPPDTHAYLADVNGKLTLVVTTAGAPFAVVDLDLVDGQISAIHLVANPEKLQAIKEIEQVGTPVELP